MTETEHTMTSKEFEMTIDELVNSMTTLHNRLQRVEKWMLQQEELKKRKNSTLITKGKLR